MISHAVGGLGLFLLGMILLTDGLKMVAGDALRSALSRFTGRPSTALLTGTVVTALIQSSSATTLMTIGFVSAGLMSFTQSVGVIFGTNIGTTSTGWIVSTLGLKVNVSAAALPVIGAGALLRLLFKGRGAAIGTALAGFGLIFLGLDTLQAGMKELSGFVDPGRFPAGASLGGRLLLVVVGALMTVVLQSSSAAVAMTLTALHAGSIDLVQAAALVVGQNVGTTVKAWLVSIGAPTAVKRTAMAHFLFNALTGVVAFAALSPLVALVDAITDRLGDGSSATTIAGFHTAFNLLGVILLFPFTRRFAAFVERLVPERGPQLARHLSQAASEVPAVALAAARRTLAEVAAVLTDVARARLEGAEPEAVEPELEPARRALDAARGFVAAIGTHEETAAEHARHVGVLQALDQLERLARACAEPAPRGPLERAGAPKDMAARIVEALEACAAALREGDALPAALRLAEASRANADARRAHEPALLGRTAAGHVSPAAALAELDVTRWVDRVGYHAWRAAHNLQDPPPDLAPLPAAPPLPRPEDRPS